MSSVQLDWSKAPIAKSMIIKSARKGTKEAFGEMADFLKSWINKGKHKSSVSAPVAHAPAPASAPAPTSAPAPASASAPAPASVLHGAADAETVSGATTTDKGPAAKHDGASDHAARSNSVHSSNGSTEPHAVHSIAATTTATITTTTATITTTTDVTAVAAASDAASAAATPLRATAATAAATTVSDGRSPRVGTSVATSWQDESKFSVCPRCNVTRFGLLTRKHHCRFCGWVVCDVCSPHRKWSPKSEQYERCCDTCARGENADFHDITKRSSSSASSPPPATASRGQQQRPSVITISESEDAGGAAALRVVDNDGAGGSSRADDDGSESLDDRAALNLSMQLKGVSSETASMASDSESVAGGPRASWVRDVDADAASTADAVSADVHLPTLGENWRCAMPTHLCY
jgi:hypothetical protein